MNCEESLKQLIQGDVEEKVNEQAVKEQAVEHLDAFTKTYCRDESVKYDLVFRCKDCEFLMKDETCLVKVMAMKLCPDYKDFGSMGDL